MRSMRIMNSSSAWSRQAEAEASLGCVGGWHKALVVGWGGGESPGRHVDLWVKILGLVDLSADQSS